MSDTVATNWRHHEQDAIPITDELLNQLLTNLQKSEGLIDADGILKQLTKKLAKRALDTELINHPGHDKRQSVNNPADSPQQLQPEEAQR